MSDEFFKKPILNSPYERPSRHWQLVDGLPTQKIIPSRREAEFITPVPKPKKRKDSASRELFDEPPETGDGKQKYDLILLINALRAEVDKWRNLQRRARLAGEPSYRAPAASLAAL